MYCKNCGHQINDEAVVCTACGAPTDNYKKVVSTSESGEKYKVAKVFMIIGCVFSALWYLIPLAWTIPMTVHLFKASKKGEKVGTAFKVCSLLFVNTIAGILLLCEE